MPDHDNDPEYYFAPPPVVSLAISGTKARFPVRRVYTVGRNYAAHAAETGLGGKSGPRPGFALRPSDCVVEDGDLPYPKGTGHLDPEVEFVIAIGKGGVEIPRETAWGHIFGYAVGFDMIRRDLMHECIENQHSWDLCKAFSGGSPCSRIVPVSLCGHPESGEIRLDVNDDRRQTGNLSDLIWNQAEIIARLSALDRLEPGDLIYTGTPRGPAPVTRGDRLHGHIEGVGDLHMTIV